MGIIKFEEFITEKKSDTIIFDSELFYKLKYTIECSEKYKKSYFWKSSSSASSRRANEIMFAKKYPDYEFEYNNDKYEVTFDYRETSKNVYFTLEIYKNGSKSNLVPIKNLYNKMKALQDATNKYNL